MTAVPPRTFVAVFDLDGTLVDSVGDITAAANKVLTAEGLGALDIGQVRPLIGLPAVEIFRHAGMADHAETAIAPFRAALADIIGQHSTVFPGVRNVLDHLASTDWQLAVATNKPTWLAQLALTRAHLDHYFRRVQGAEELAHKPDPATVVACLNALGCHQGVMIGDTTFDILAGARAGLATVALLSGSHTRDHIMSTGPDAIYTDMTDLHDSIGALERLASHTRPHHQTPTWALT